MNSAGSSYALFRIEIFVKDPLWLKVVINFDGCDLNDAGGRGTETGGFGINENDPFRHDIASKGFEFERISVSM